MLQWGRGGRVALISQVFKINSGLVWLILVTFSSKYSSQFLQRWWMQATALIPNHANQHEQMIFICCRIWKARNAGIFEGKDWSSHQNIEKASSHMYEYQQSLLLERKQSTVERPGNPTSLPDWQPPPLASSRLILMVT